jgi:hypothetical protein
MWNSTGFMDREVQKIYLVNMALAAHFKLVDFGESQLKENGWPKFIDSMVLVPKSYHTIRAKFTDTEGVEQDLNFTFDYEAEVFEVDSKGEVLLSFSPWNYAGQYMKFGRNVDLTWVLRYLFPR